VALCSEEEEEILDQAIAMLQRRGRLTYRTLKRQLQLDDAALDDVKNELIEGQRLAVDEWGNVLVWTGDTAGAVRVNALGPVPVKGLAEPVEVFELVGATSVHRRLQAAVARGLTRFVGRDQGLAALTQALAQAGQGQGLLVALLGEAGVG